MLNNQKPKKTQKISPYPTFAILVPVFCFFWVANPPVNQMRQ